MNKRYHVVRITRDGYLYLSSHKAGKQAMEALFASGVRLGPVVLRDGKTGKRFSWAELEREAA